MVSEAVALGLDEADGLLRRVQSRVGEAVGGYTHVAVGLIGVEVEHWVER